MLSPRLDVRVSQKQTLTPGLVQLVTVLQLNRLELKEMISQELVANPFLDESEDGEELTPQEVQTLLEAERIAEPSDQAVMEMLSSQETEAEAAGEPARRGFEQPRHAGSRRAVLLARGESEGIAIKGTGSPKIGHR